LEQIEQIKQVVRKGRLEILNQMNEDSKERIRKREYLTYSRRKKALDTSPSNPKPPHIIYPLPLDTIAPLQPTLPKNDNIDLNIDMASVLAKVNVTIPLTKIMKTPSLRDKVKIFLSIQDDFEDPLVV
jgi:hypothetical protein